MGGPEGILESLAWYRAEREKSRLVEGEMAELDIRRGRVREKVDLSIVYNRGCGRARFM